jgi:DHA2 family multidrug resistance protein
MSIWGMGIMVGPIMGPLIGGYLTDNFDWRWVFYVNLPIGVVCVAILWFLLPSRPIAKRRFDMFGFSMLSLGIAGLQLMLDRGQGEDWLGSTEIWVEMLIAVIAIWMFVVHMATAKQPMFDREIWKDRNLVTAIGFMLVVGVVMMATMALLPPMLQNLYNHSVLDTGLLLMPRGFGVVLTMAVSAQLTQRGFDPRYLVGAGMSVAAFSLWQMTHWSLDMDAWPVIISGFIQGLGMGLVFMPLNSLAFATLSHQFRTDGASLLNLMRSIGQSAGISMVTVLLARNIQTSHSDLASHVTSQTIPALDLGALDRFGGLSDSVFGYADAMINKQAAMIAYIDDFYLMAWISIGVLPLVLLLRKPKGKVEAVLAE